MHFQKRKGAMDGVRLVPRGLVKACEKASVAITLCVTELCPYLLVEWKTFDRCIVHPDVLCRSKLCCEHGIQCRAESYLKNLDFACRKSLKKMITWYYRKQFCKPGCSICSLRIGTGIQTNGDGEELIQVQQNIIMLFPATVTRRSLQLMVCCRGLSGYSP